MGRRLSSDAIHNLDGIVNYLEAGRWMHANGYDVRHRVDRREQLFDLIGKKISEREVLYLEFGVFRGDATRYWSKLLRNPNSHLHGFDSFEGLPESLVGIKPKGHWSAGGRMPSIDDPRVQFFKGLFSQTLPDYKCPPHEELVLIMDADLYTSTLFVLNAMEQQIVPGTYLYFDEFSHRFDEMHAFEEFVGTTGMEFSLLGASRDLMHVLFQRC